MKLYREEKDYQYGNQHIAYLKFMFGKNGFHELVLMTTLMYTIDLSLLEITPESCEEPRFKDKGVVTIIWLKGCKLWML